MTTGLLCGKDERNDQTVEPKRFGENENKNHADEQLRLLGGGTHAGVADNADRHTGSKTAEADSETGARWAKP